MTSISKGSSKFNALSPNPPGFTEADPVLTYSFKIGCWRVSSENRSSTLVSDKIWAS